MILNDKQITELALKWEMIDPFYQYKEKKTHDGEKAISYGLSSFGYDVRVGPEFQVFSNVRSGVIDPKAFDESCCVEVSGTECLIPPGGFALAHTVEYIRMPTNVTALCTNKSTYARAGIVTPCTVIEAGWEGTITLEISNTTSLPAKVYAGEGIAQLIFFKGKEPLLDYVARGGKYQGQSGVTFPR